MKEGMHDLADHSVRLFRVSEATGVAVTALYRDSDFNAGGFPDHVNHQARQPAVLRLVELDGSEGRISLDFVSPVLRAWKCTMLGEVVTEVRSSANRLNLTLRPHEIATLAVEFPAAPSEDKTLDNDRSIWATVHLDAVADHEGEI